MATRREFLQAGIAASTLPMVGGVPVRAAAAGAPELALYATVYDERFPVSVAFGREIARAGNSTYAISGDITDFWYHRVDRQWRERPLAIAGLTSHGPIFCLEHLAWEVRQRVVFRAEHRSLPDGSVEHVLDGPESLVRAAAEIASAGASWSRGFAGLLRNAKLGVSPSAQSRFVTPAAGPSHGADSLYTWLIAPSAPAVA